VHGRQENFATYCFFRHNDLSILRDLPLRLAIWIFIIIHPIQWIGFDVTMDTVVIIIISDDVFIMISLPDNLSLRITQ
jgi:hypothetical protein